VFSPSLSLSLLKTLRSVLLSTWIHVFQSKVPRCLVKQGGQGSPILILILRCNRFILYPVKLHTIAPTLTPTHLSSPPLVNTSVLLIVGLCCILLCSAFVLHSLDFLLLFLLFVNSIHHPESCSITHLLPQPRREQQLHRDRRPVLRAG
jgi:hypothetical protein